MIQSRNYLGLTAVGVIFFSISSGYVAVADNREAPLTSSKEQFSEVAINLEYNATDGDGELVVFSKGPTEGLAQLKINAPNGRSILDLSTKDRLVGIREFDVETAEPMIDTVISAYPEGLYRFGGVTLGGSKLHALAQLVHKLPAPPEIHVNKETGTVSWSSVVGAAKYSVALERKIDNEKKMVLTIDLPATARMFSIPKVFAVPGDYQVAVAVHGENGNVTEVEYEFTLNMMVAR